MTYKKNGNKNISDAVLKVIKYAKKRRSMAIYAVWALNSDSLYFEKKYFGE